jgi:hypothetical protein
MLKAWTPQSTRGAQNTTKEPGTNAATVPQTVGKKMEKLLKSILRLLRGFVRFLQTNADKIIGLVRNTHSSVMKAKTKPQNQIIKQADLTTIRTNTKGSYFPSKAKNSSTSR